MAYKKKLITLISLIAVLSLVFALTFVFDPQRSGERSAAYTWLDSKQSGGISRIILTNDTGKIELLKTGGQWLVSNNGIEYPARTFRVEDLIGTLTKRAAYPLRSTSASSHERLGLTEDAASRITVYGQDARAQPLLDLLVGHEDNTGNNVYIRRAGQNEVRSGATIVKSFLSGNTQYWYNLRLIPESENAKLDVDGVQRLSIYVEEDPPQVFSRWNNEWAISGLTVEKPDMSKVDAYIRVILNTEANDFVSEVQPDDPMFGRIRAALELSNGSVKTISLSDENETGKRYAVVTGSQYVYSLESWAVQRLFKTAADFEKQ